jgi:hypothetical protein
MEDRVVIDQQQNESWATDIGSHHFEAMSEEAHPIFTDVKLKTMDTPQQEYTQKMKELELWHQRMGHCSARTLNETRKCVEGIPDLPTNNPFFKCPFCERRKMVKKGGNKTVDKDSFIPGQAYHMDLGYQNTMHNIKYWDINTGSAKHDSKDEIQYGDNPHNRSPASKHLMEVFTGSADHTTATELEHVEIELKHKMSTSPIDILERSLLDSPLPYTVAAAAKVNRKQQRWMDRKINKMKAAYLKHELSTLDISTNKYVHTTSHTIPLNEKAYHPTLGLIVSSHQDMKHAVELVEFQVGTSTHRHIRSWKRRLRGTIITTINDEPITNEEDIIAVIQRARNNKQTTIKIEYGSLVGFAMSGERVPTLQSDQLNVIAHHLRRTPSQCGGVLNARDTSR